MKMKTENGVNLQTFCTEVNHSYRPTCTGWAKKVSLPIFAITLSTASQFA